MRSATIAGLRHPDNLESTCHPKNACVWRSRVLPDKATLPVSRTIKRTRRPVQLVASVDAFDQSEWLLESPLPARRKRFSILASSLGTTTFALLPHILRLNRSPFFRIIGTDHGSSSGN